MKSIIIWGTGRRALSYFQKEYFNGCNIVGIIDSYKKEEQFMNLPVYLPECLPDLMEKADYLVVANQSPFEIHDKCIELGIDLKRVIFTDSIKLPTFYNNIDAIKDCLPLLYREIWKSQWILIKPNTKDRTDIGKMIGTTDFDEKGYFDDYFRYRTFEFIADEILDAKLEGEVAELGVFRADFSRLINKKFSDKKLYLFDTFEGFDSSEAEKEIIAGNCNRDFVEAFKDTSVERVLKNLLFPEKCIICKGLFPQSVTSREEQETYCFVSLDVDLEDSIYAGIEFFYPRLVEGGVLYIHDYNSFLKGVRNAVKRYEQDHGILLKKIPLADYAGSLAVIK